MTHDIYKDLRLSNTVKQLGRALAVQLHTNPLEGSVVDTSARP